MTACGVGGDDLPFIFGDGSTNGGNGGNNPSTSSCTTTGCPSGKTCDAQSGQCVASQTPACTQDSDCSSGQTCTVSTGVCSTPSPSGCTSDASCPSGQVCTVSTGQCGLPGACEEDFNASLVLKIDDNFSSGRFDSPPKCCAYADADGGSLCPASVSEGFLQTPSENSDLYCCGSDSGADVPGHPVLVCDTEDRPGGTAELAATRWAPQNGGKIRLKFAISGSSCQVSMVRDLFPEYRLENSALDASLIIDAGKKYNDFPKFPASSRDLNPDEIVAPCAVTQSGGNVQVAIPSLPLRFFVQLYKNYKKCVEVDDGGSSCPSAPFAERFLGDTEGSFQIIPGFSGQALNLTTVSSSIAAVNPANQSGALNTQGAVLQYNTTTQKTTLSLVTSFSLPPLDTSRDDDAGTGQLLAELGEAILTAELSGNVTKGNGQAIQTLADLTTDCGTGSNPGTGNRLEVSVKTNFNSLEDTLTVTGDAANASSPFTAEACIPTRHQGSACDFSNPALLPFAKDVAAGDPATGTEAKFTREGTITVQSGSGSTANVTLQVPERVGAFHILNSASLQNITLASGNSATLQVRFEPETNASGCSTSGGVVSCQASLSLSSSHSVTVTLKGQAKVPAAEMALAEIATATPFATTSTLLPASATPTVDFGETLLRLQTKTKLYRISNTGVRPLSVSDIRSQDIQANFRVGSIYKGPDFEHRVWAVGQNPWAVAANGSSDLFFFLNYGPFGKSPSGSTRQDAALLTINTTSGNAALNLTGTAKNDTRATLALYVEDANRYLITGDSDADLLNVVEGTETKRLYVARDLLWSFRQDNTPRAVYLVNAGEAAGIDDLAVQRLAFTADAAGKITFTPDTGATVTGCLAALDTATTACTSLASTGDASRLKLGTLTFAASSTGTYAVSSGNFLVKALSQPTAGREGTPPKVKGVLENTNAIVNYALKGANGAPSGTFDLKIHRLMAGFSNKINQGLQDSLITSTSTKGILTRFNSTSAPDVNIEQTKDVFTLRDGISLDPVTGAAVLKRIVSAVDADMNNPASPSSPSFQGLRLYNAFGSSPSQTEYFAECKTSSSSPKCAFFYLFIGDWTTSLTSSTCNGSPKVPAIANYAGNQAQRDALFATVMKPDVPAEFACLSGADGFKDKKGIFDPVTGELTFRDLVVRLYAPKVPALSNQDVDATLRLNLTTRCVTTSEVPDPAAREKTAVESRVLTDNAFDTFLMGANPMAPFVDQTGTVCGAERTLHGRPMFAEDTTGTLDNDSDSDDLNFEGMDLAGVGRNVASSTQVAPANMYIVIKAEVGDF